MNELKTVKEWYTEEQVVQYLKRQKKGSLEKHQQIPEDIYSIEFAKWITEQSRLAMLKGMYLQRQHTEGTNEETKPF